MMGQYCIEKKDMAVIHVKCLYIMQHVVFVCVLSRKREILQD